MFSSIIKKVCLSESGENYGQTNHCLQEKTVLHHTKQMCWWILMWEDNRDGLFHWRKCFWLSSWNALMMDLFVTCKQISADGLELCGLLCFYQLFGFSFWRHPFTAEDPLVSDVLFLQSVPMMKQTLRHFLALWHFDGLRISTFSVKYSIFGFIFRWSITLTYFIWLENQFQEPMKLELVLSSFIY